MQVPILRIPFDQEDRQFLHNGIDELLDSGYLTLGKWTQQFEEMFASFSGTRYCTAVNSGTAAIEVIIRALGIEGASIIVPTDTFLATALAVVHSGNRVIFADSDPETLSLDIDDVERSITPDTKAVILVHIGGIISPQWRRLQQLCEDRRLYLIEDCAHAHGCSIDGKAAGTLGVAGAFSFFPTKVLTTGEGGVIVTNDEEIYRKSNMIRNQGKNPDMGNRISELGHNFRMSEMTALVGVQQMRKAEAVLDQRRHIAECYDHLLANVEGVRPVKPFGPSGYYKYVVYLAEGIDRGKLKNVMRSDYEVSLTGEVYAELCHDEPLWETFTLCGKARNGGEPVCSHPEGADCRARRTDFPKATYISNNHICLPLYPGLSDEQANYVVDSLAAALHQIG